MSRSTMQRQGEPTAPRGSARVRGFVRRHPGAFIATGFLAAGFVVFVLLWFEPQKAFTNKRVDEALPARITTATAPGGSGSPAVPSAAPSATGTAKVLGRGQFRSLEHRTSGRAILLEAPEGLRLLRLTDLDALDGPDLRVYLSELPAELGERAYGERFADLGALKGNKGNQNYEIPGEVDVAKYRSVVIWCRRFSVGFGVAPLER
jgi:hypothetical protein